MDELLKAISRRARSKPEMLKEKILSSIAEAGVILVDDAFDFDINKWEQEVQDEINEQLKENTPKNTITANFIEYKLTPERVKIIVEKIVNSTFNIVDYWKTNQFKKKNNLTNDDLKDILRTLTPQDYNSNSISIDDTNNEAVIFIKNTNIKNLNNVKLYIKLDYDSIEQTPVIVISFHSAVQNTTIENNADVLLPQIYDKLDKFLDNRLSQYDFDKNGDV